MKILPLAASLVGLGCAAELPASSLVLESRNRPATCASADRVRIVTFNLQWAANVGRIAAAVRGDPALRDADVLLLQEVRSYPAEGGSRAARLADALDMSYVYSPSRHVGGGGTHGLAVLSRCPIRDAAVLPLRRFRWPVSNRMTALAATIDYAPGRSLRVYDVHLSTTINAGERIEQLRAVVDVARAERAERVVIGGDFNTNRFAWLFHLIPVYPTDQAARVDDFMRASGFDAPVAGSGRTARLPIFNLRLDSLYTRGLETSAFRVERAIAVSDHLPLWMDVDP